MVAVERCWRQRARRQWFGRARQGRAIGGQGDRGAGRSGGRGMQGCSNGVMQDGSKTEISQHSCQSTLHLYLGIPDLAVVPCRYVDECPQECTNFLKLCKAK